MNRLVSMVALIVFASVFYQDLLTAQNQANTPPPMFGDYKVQVPLIPARVGAFKIAENESPRPHDRVYVNYNYFNDIKRDLAPGTESNHRQTLGLEKTLSAKASVGVRLPFFERRDATDFKVGDLSFLLKYAPIDDRDSGNALSLTN